MKETFKASAFVLNCARQTAAILINPRWSIDAHAPTFRCPCALSFAALIVHRPGTDEPHTHEQSSRCTLIATAQTAAAPNFRPARHALICAARPRRCARLHAGR